MDINLVKILFYVLSFQFIFVSLFLFQNKRGKALSNKLLATVFLMISTAIIDLYLLVFKIEITRPQLLLIIDTFMFAYGPLLYLFTQSVVFKNYQLQKKSIIHFIPFLFAIAFVIGIILIVDTTSINEVNKQNYNLQAPLSFRIGEFIILSHIFIYLFKSKQEIKNVIGKAKDLYSTFNQENFKLLKFILNSFIILFGISLIHSLLPFIGNNKRVFITLMMMILFMFYFINSILLKMLNQSTKDSGVMMQHDYREKEKYAGSSLSAAYLDTYMKSVGDHMKSKERFLDSELTMADLSRELNIPSKTLSQVINEGYSCNFFDYVNGFRVEKAKSIFSDPSSDKLTIQEVMYDSGFNSKSSFNTSFKKFTNLTPTQYRNSI